MERRMSQLDRQDEVLEFIGGYTRACGYPPSRREIAAVLEMSPSTVQLILKDMIEQKLIEVAPGIARGVIITGSNMKHGEVAL
jgi:SOS-response transcriptional repressor LexA